MGNITPLFIIAAAVALLCMPAPVAATDTFTEITVLPEGVLWSGDSVTGSFALVTDEPFSEGDNATLETALEESAWKYTVETDGVERVRSGYLPAPVTIPWYELAYPSAKNIKITVHFSGTVPEVTEEQYVTLVTACSSHTYPDHGVGRCMIAPREVRPVLRPE